MCTRRHGAKAPQVVAARERRQTKARAEGEVAELLAEAYGVVSGQTSTEQVIEGIRFAGSMALGYRWLLEELPVKSEWSFETHIDKKGAKTRFVNVDTAGLVGPDAQGQMRLHAYEEGARHWSALHAKLIKAAHDMAIDEREQARRQAEVATIGAAIRAVVEGLGRQLDEPTVVPVVERALRIVSGER